MHARTDALGRQRDRGRRPGRAARGLQIVGGALLLLLVAACGGGDGSDILDQVARTGNAGGEEVEFNLDPDGFEADIGDADISFGGDRPDWLEAEYVLPENLDLQLAINDPSTGERALQGTVPAGDAAAILASQHANLQSIGYEQLGDSSVYVHPERMPLDLLVEAGDGLVYFAMTHRYEDEQTLRDVYAPIEGRGTLNAVIDGEATTFEGTCERRSDSGSFASDDGTANLTVEVRAGEQDYILADFLQGSADVFRSWTVLQVDDQGNYPEVAVGADGFRFDGFLIDLAGSAPAPVPATIEVACPG